MLEKWVISKSSHWDKDVNTKEQLSTRSVRKIIRRKIKLVSTKNNKIKMLLLPIILYKLQFKTY